MQVFVVCTTTKIVELWSSVKWKERLFRNKKTKVTKEKKKPVNKSNSDETFKTNESL